MSERLNRAMEQFRIGRSYKDLNYLIDNKYYSDIVNYYEKNKELLNVAKYYVMSGKIYEAAEIYETLKMYDEAAKMYRLANDYMNYARIMKTINKNISLKYYMKLLSRMPYNGEYVEALLAIASIKYELGESYHEQFVSARSIMERLDDQEDIFTANEALGDFAVLIGRADLVNEGYRTAIENTKDKNDMIRIYDKYFIFAKSVNNISLMEQIKDKIMRLVK